MKPIIKLPFWATLFTVLGVMVLCALGTWQLQRLAWKAELLEKLDKAYDAPITDPNVAGLDPDQFFVVSIEGRFLFDAALLMGHVVVDGQAGQNMIVPLETDQGVLLVDMGFNPQEDMLEEHKLKPYRNKVLRFTGLLYKPEWNAFTPPNIPQDDIWYRADIEQIADAKSLAPVLPFMMRGQSVSPAFGDIDLPKNERLQPNNNHAQYALFWFSLALALIVIYALRFLRAKS